MEFLYLDYILDTLIFPQVILPNKEHDIQNVHDE
jgi:hypothetical protein